MAFLPQLIYRFSTISVKIPEGFFVEIGKLILSYTGKCEGPKIAKIILKKNKFGGLIVPIFKTSCKATVIKTLWGWHKDRHIGQWNRIENLEINLCEIYSQLIFNKGTKKFSRKSVISLTNTVE